MSSKIFESITGSSTIEQYRIILINPDQYRIVHFNLIFQCLSITKILFAIDWQVWDNAHSNNWPSYSNNLSREKMKFLLFLSTVDCYRRTPYKEELLKIGNKFQIRDRVEFEGISCNKKENKDRFFIFSLRH